MNEVFDLIKCVKNYFQIIIENNNTLNDWTYNNYL